MMVQKFLARIMLGLFAALAFSSPAHAGYVAKNLEVYGYGLERFSLSGTSNCLNFVFDSVANLNKCFVDRAKARTPYYYPVRSEETRPELGDYFAYCDGDNRVGIPGEFIAYMFASGPNMALEGSYSGNTGMFFLRYTGDTTMYMRGPNGNYYPVVPTGTFCPNYYHFGNEPTGPIAWSVEQVPEEGDDEPEPEQQEDTCELNAEWAGFAIPKLKAGDKPAIGHNFGVAYPTAVAMPAHYSDGGTSVSPTPPGEILIQQMATGHECMFRRDVRGVVVDGEGVTLTTYSMSYWGVKNGMGSPAPGPAAEIVVTARQKTSKPPIAYGTQYNAAGIVTRETTLAEASREMTKVTGGITTPQGQPLPAKLQAKCPSIGGQCLLPYTHPAPEQLKRDNPDCQSFDPRCAWAPSPTQAATPETPKEQLVRLSKDGQTIVVNNPQIYPDTRYPQVMVNAGTAPPDNSQPEVTQTKIRQILERFSEGREDRPVAAVRFEHIDSIISRARTKTVDEKGRTYGGIEAAKKLRKELRRLFAFARKLGWISTNPVDDSQAVRVSPSERSTGFYTWTEDDIAAYRARWKLGTKQRLAMELMLWTDQRKVDAIHLGRQHVRDGKFVIRQTKTAKLLTLPIAPPLADAIGAMPPSDSMCFLVTQWKKPFSVKGFGGWFREQCDAAGLPKCTAHGLRKATMRRMAELEMPNKTMKSVSGHSKDDEVARYTEAANQARLAEAAIRRLVEWENSNPLPSSSESA